MSLKFFSSVVRAVDRQSKDLGSNPNAVKSVFFSTERFSNSLNISSKYLIKEKNSQAVFNQTTFYFNVYFVSHIFWLKNGYFYHQYLKSKHKIYILSKNFLLRIRRPHSNNFLSQGFFRMSQILFKKLNF